MNVGRIAVLVIVGVGLLGGALMFYLQVWGYYDDAPLEPDLVAIDGINATIYAYEGIDADSSPIRYRACFEIDPVIGRALPDAPEAEPLNAPFWFDCFDAEDLGADLASGEARAVMLRENLRPGVDRVAAIYPDGRAYAWQQLNDLYDDSRRIE